MASLNLFKNSVFQMMQLTQAFEKLPIKPSLLGDMGLFEFEGIRQKTFAIESVDGVLTLIPFSERGAPTQQDTQEEREVRAFLTRHFKKQAKIWAAEIAGVREFGSETELKQMQKEVLKRAMKLRREAELTFEYHRLNAIQGLVKNTTGASVYNWYTEFGIDVPDVINFDLDNATPVKGALRMQCHDIADGIADSLGGDADANSLEIEAVAHPSFFNKFTSHKEVLEAWMYAGKVAEQTGKTLKTFEWGGITWRKYRGGSGVSLAAGEVRFVPKGVPGMFRHYASPAETGEFVNTPGLEHYFRLIPDLARDEYVELELEANPMFICTRPGALRKGTRTS